MATALIPATQAAPSLFGGAGTALATAATTGLAYATGMALKKDGEQADEVLDNSATEIVNNNADRKMLEMGQNYEGGGPLQETCFGDQMQNNVKKGLLYAMVTAGVVKGGYYAYKKWTSVATKDMKDYEKEFMKSWGCPTPKDCKDAVDAYLKAVKDDKFEIRLLTDNDGNTLFHRTAQGCNSNILTSMESVMPENIGDILLNNKNTSGKTPIVISIENNCHEVFANYLAKSVKEEENINFYKELGEKGDGITLSIFRKIMIQKGMYVQSIKGFMEKADWNTFSKTALLFLMYRRNGDNKLPDDNFRKGRKVSEFNVDAIITGVVNKENYKNFRATQDIDLSQDELRRILDIYVKSQNDDRLVNAEKLQHDTTINDCYDYGIPLLNYGTDLNFLEAVEKYANDPNTFGDTPLISHIVHGKGKIEDIRFLLEKGADPNLKDVDGYDSYFLATIFNRFRILKELLLKLDKSSKTKILTDKGETPLFFVSNKVIMLLLLEQGVDPLHRRKVDNYSFLDILEIKGFTVMIDIFKNRYPEAYSSIKEADKSLFKQECQPLQVNTSSSKKQKEASEHKEKAEVAASSSGVSVEKTTPTEIKSPTLTESKNIPTEDLFVSIDSKNLTRKDIDFWTSA